MNRYISETVRKARKSFSYFRKDVSDEPRDDHGRWTSGGGYNAETAGRKKQGFFSGGPGNPNHRYAPPGKLQTAANMFRSRRNRTDAVYDPRLDPENPAYGNRPPGFKGVGGVSYRAPSKLQTAANLFRSRRNRTDTVYDPRLDPANPAYGTRPPGFKGM